MGWANCGQDSQGRQIGYAHPATCDHPGCHEKIDRGLAYACGPMHGECDYYCEKYFCMEHKTYVEIPWHIDEEAWVCFECAKAIEEMKDEDDVEVQN